MFQTNRCYSLVSLATVNVEIGFGGARKLLDGLMQNLNMRLIVHSDQVPANFREYPIWLSVEYCRGQYQDVQLS